MSELSYLSIDELMHQSAAYNPSDPAKALAAQHELLRRAFCHANDSAWDVIVPILWSQVLRWIYTAQPDVSPAKAELLGYRVILHFRSDVVRLLDPAQDFPSLEVLLTHLKRITTAILARHEPDA